MKRILFIKFLFFAATVSAFSQNAADSSALLAFLDYAGKEKIMEKETGERVVSIARFFLGTPYVASTLEAEAPERLQVNLKELDCTTFVENVLALHNLFKELNPNLDAFKRILSNIRYRNGVIDGYPSRLHYITDWMLDNQKKGYVNFVEMGCASKKFRPKLYFMTEHLDLYPALKDNPQYVEEMRLHEARLNGLFLKYMPKDELTDSVPFIQTGDIIAITTAVHGMDFSHIGFAVRQNGVVYLLHASSSEKKVTITNQSLKYYLSGIRNHTGIVVIRPV